MALLLDAPLKISNVLSTGTGNPTATRATTKNVFDNEGKLITVKTGGRTFGGARCAQNWLRDLTSNNFTSAITGACVLTYLSGVTTAEVTGASSYFRPYVSAYTEFSYIGATPYFAIQARGVGPSIGKKIYIITESSGNLQTPVPFILTADWQSVYFDRPAKINTNQESSYIALNLDVSSTVGVGETVEFKELQVSPYICEYVSVGVLAAPYHGGGVDGVKFFDTDSNGDPILDADLLGDHVDPASKTNTLLYCRDFTNAAWVKTNITAAKTQTGITGQSNSCSLLTCNSAGATVLQTITAAAAAGCSGFWVKRGVGAGTIEITRDNVTWLDITSELSTDDFYVAKIENTSVTNPVVGFRMGTVNDTIIVDAGLNHLGTVLCEPIFTTTANVTRNADAQSYPVAANFSDTAGTILATVYRDNWTNNHDGLIGSTTSGLGTLSTNDGVKAVDGTNTANGPTGTPTGQKHLAIRWSGTTLEALSEAIPGTAGTYDGSFGLASIGIGVGGISNIRDVRIYDNALTDAEIATAFGIGAVSVNSIWDNDAAMAYFSANGYNGTYNDAMLAWLRDYYTVSGKTLPDLVARYIAQNGPYLP